MNHKAVIFDLGKVLIPFDFTRGYAEIEKLTGIPAADIPKKIVATDLVRRFESGKIEPQAFVSQLCELLGMKTGYDGFCEVWSSIFLPDPLIPESLLAGLRQRYRLLLLSNTNAIHFEMLRRTHGFFAHFHDIVLSYEVGAMKPDPRIYRAAIERAGCRPEECFYTDDIAEYVEGGKREGMDAVQFHSREQLERELKARGIEW